MKPPCPKPCRECPWRRVAINGWLGPYDITEWLHLAHSDEMIACHLTIPEGQIDLIEPDYGTDGDTSRMTQCTGAAIYRRNVAKSPRNRDIVQMPADTETIFASPMQFREHHEKRPSS